MSNEQAYDDARRSRYRPGARVETTAGKPVTVIGPSAYDPDMVLGRIDGERIPAWMDPDSGRVMHAALPEGTTAIDATWEDGDLEPPRQAWPFWLVAVLAAGAVFALTVVFGGVRL